LLAEALTVSRQVGQPTTIADILIRFGLNSNIRGAYRDAHHCWEEALAIYQELGNDYGIGVSYNWLGWSHWCAGSAQLTAAVSCYERAILKYQQCNARVVYGMALGDLAHALLDLGDYERAMQSAQEGLRICEATGAIHMILYLLNMMGAAVCAYSDFANARKYLIESLALAQAHGLLVNCGRTLCFFAELLVAESQATSNVEVQQEKLHLARQLYHSALRDPGTWQVYKDRAKPKLESINLLSLSIPSGEEAAEPKSVEEWAIQILTHEAY
jgi:tetratricopeptide (TPR) repeat protein